MGLSVETNPVLAAKEAVMQAKVKMQKSKIHLAIVFCSTDLSSPSLLENIVHSLEGIPVIGSSGAAIISNQGIFKHGLVIMLLGFSEGTHFNVAFVKDIKEKSGLKAGEELGEKLLNRFETVRRNLGIVLSDALIEESSGLINGIQEKLGKSFPLVGGSASDNLTFLKTHLFFNQEMFDNGCVGLLLAGKLNFGLGIKHGWKPLGKPHTVTSSAGTVVYEIDNVPAARLYEDYLGCHLSRLKKELKHVSILYPIGIYVPGEEEYLLRNIISLGDDGSLHFQGNVPEDSQIRLMISTQEHCFAATQTAVDEAKKRLSKESAELKKDGTKNFVIVFSSISRYLLLKRRVNKELEIIKKGFAPHTPIIGLYTYGELAPLLAINYLGQVYLHNQTVAVLSVGG